MFSSQDHSGYKMLSKSKAGLIISLQKKKVREEKHLFVIEGDKIVRDFLASGLKISTLVGVPEFLESIPDSRRQQITEVIRATGGDLKKVSSLKTPHNALAIIEMADIKISDSNPEKGLSIALDCIQDPGNLGTIIRSAAWFGIKTIYCSKDCADAYNPKVIQSSMGSIIHVNVIYDDLQKILEFASCKKIRIFGAVLGGESIYSHMLVKNGIILLGNESRGISEGLLPFITDKITIPGPQGSKAVIDSLNVGMAASIIFSEFSRRSEYLV